MSYQPDPVNKDIVISGFAAGIGPDPYTGPSDMKSIGLESVPNEASVAFSTQAVSAATIGTILITTSSTVGNTITFLNNATVANLEDNMAVVFSQSSIANVTVGNVYWISAITQSGGNYTAQLFTEYGAGGSANTIGNVSTATMEVINMSVPTYFAQDQSSHYYCVDNNGNVWSNNITTPSGKWTHLGNSVPVQGQTNTSNGILGKTGTDLSYGNGLVIFGTPGSGAGHGYYLFVFSNGSIDYVKIGNPWTWIYGWRPADGGTGIPAPYLTNCPNSGNYLGGPSVIHQAIIGPDNNFYYLNGYDVNKLQLAIAGVFDPATGSDFSQTTYNLLPTNDISQCITPLGTNYLIGGVKNVVYMWDSTSNLSSYYILLSENNIKNLITVNTNAYIFVGNRGRIWITNGSQAQIFAKVPDHLSGTIDPLFTWGGAAYNWNQLYFGLQAYDNAGNLISNYGGLWAIDITTNALRNVGEMSYGTYDGSVNSIFPVDTTQVPSSLGAPRGYGLLMGWNDGTGNGGIDQSISTPYTGGQSWVTSELIPIGLAINPFTPSQLEFKLSRPLVAGESVKLKIGQYLDPSYASFSTCTFSGATSFSSVGAISGITDGIPLDKFQWIIVQAILTSTASSPSFVRLTELRIKNALLPISGYSSIQ